MNKSVSIPKRKITALFMSICIALTCFASFKASAVTPQIFPDQFGIDLNELIDNGTLQYMSYSDETTGINMNYWIHAPEDYMEKSYPMLVYFHGHGGGGTKMGNIENNTGIIYQLLTEYNLENNPCIIVAPQTPQAGGVGDESKWVNLGDSWYHDYRDMDTNPRTKNLTTAYNIIEYVEDNYNVDSDRLYVTGLSMGGMATWDLGTRNPDKFAAIAPVCGVGDYKKAAILSDMPIRTFHGTMDDIVPVNATRSMYNALAEYGNITYTEYPDEMHESWNVAYGKDNVQDLIDWMFNQSKNGTLDGKTDTAPLEQIISSAEGLKEDDYTAETWEKITALKNEAENTINSGSLTDELNSYYCKNLTDLMKQEKVNVALSAQVTANKYPTFNTSLKGLNDGIIVDNVNNFTSFAANDLAEITFSWDTPQTVSAIDFHIFMGTVYGPRKYELRYKTFDSWEYISLGERTMNWKGSANYEFENDLWVLDNKLENVSDIQVVIKEGAGSDIYYTIQEIKILGEGETAYPEVTSYEEMAEIKAKSVKEAVEMLPKYTTVYLSNSDKVTSLIDWNTDEPEDNFTGEIVLKGVFDLPNGYENSNGVQPEIKITVKPDIVMGDVNGDNQINIEDVTILMKYIVRAEGIDINEASADMNNDGIINILDATEIQILLAK